MSVSWFLIGLTLGVTAGLLYGWLIMRRLERHVASITIGGGWTKRDGRSSATSATRKPW